VLHPALEPNLAGGGGEQRAVIVVGRSCHQLRSLQLQNLFFF
jgi:hypothetical protein